MKCPKCGYHSFEHLENCRKCAHDLGEHKTKFNLRGFFSPPQQASQDGQSAVAEDRASTDIQNKSEVDFGFDFLDEDEPQAVDFADSEVADIDLAAEGDDLNISRPFDIDSESIPAEEPIEKKDKGSEFEF